jgi:AraC-like DNA-binding protein
LEQDSLIDLSYNTIPEGKGASLNWTSEDYGPGSITVTSAEENKMLASDVDLGEFGKAVFIFNLLEKGDKTDLELEFSASDIGYFERYFMFLFKGQLEISLDQTLVRIRQIAEELRLSRISDPELIETEALPIMVIITTAKTSEFKTIHAESLERIQRYLDRRKIAITGDPLCVFYSYDPSGESTFGSGFPIEKKTWSWKDYTCIVIEPGKVATLTHWGDFSSAKPYLSLDKYLSDIEMEADSFIWESYKVTPETEEDTSLWQKQLFYPVKESEEQEEIDAAS